MIDVIRHRDCCELMREIPDHSVDMVLCDPPYGIDYQSQRRKDKSTWKPKIANDKVPFIGFIPEMSRIVKSSGCVLLFTRWDVQQQFIDAMSDNDMKPKSVIIWDKVIHGMGDLKRAPGSRYESIIYWAGKDFRFPGKRPVDIVRCQRVNPNELLHPNEKPIELLEELIRSYSRPGDVVFDACMGSGSSIVAAINTDRHYIGFELDSEHYETANRRVNDAFLEMADCL